MQGKIKFMLQLIPFIGICRINPPVFSPSAKIGDAINAAGSWYEGRYRSKSETATNSAEVG